MRSWLHGTDAAWPGQLPAKTVRRATVQLQSRLRTLCRSLRKGQLEQQELLRGVGHTVDLGHTVTDVINVIIMHISTK